MQNAYIAKLMEIAETDSKVMHVLADSGTGYDEMFRVNFPKQIVNFGIGEENMVAAAAGMATAGKIPFVFTAGAFLAYRSFEFIRDDICFQNLNVKIVGMGSGFAWSTLGPTHHTSEDIAVLRSIPNLMILSPSTPKQVSESVRIAYEHKGPVYIRIGMNKEKEFFPEDYRQEPSKNDLIKDGKDAVLFTTGSILEEVMEAYEFLKNDGINASVVCASTIKPFDYKNVFDMAQIAKRFFTIEEHSVYGGLFGIISEAVASKGLGVKVKALGLEDCFAEGYGTQKQVRKYNGLDAESIYRKIKDSLKNE